MNDHLEDRVRRLLREADHDEPRAVGTHILLADIHRGARQRRRRRATLVAAASVLAVAGLSTVAVQQSGHGAAPDVARRPTPSPVAPSPATPTPDRPAATGAPGALPRDAALGTTGIDGTPSGAAWRVTAEDCGGTVCARVSHDDGSGWTALRVIEWADPATGRRSPDAPVEAVEVAPSGQDAWVYGHQLWSTHDAGASWHRVNLGAQAPAQRVVVASQGTRVFALQAQPLRLWESDVSGDGWREVTLPRGYTVGEGLSAVDGTVAITTYASSGDRRVLLTTHDAGGTWQESALPCVGEFGPVQATARAMFLHCSTGSGPGMNVWRSLDGDHWGVMATVRVSTYVDDVVPVDDRTVLVVTGDGGLLLTSRGEQRVDLRLARDETVLFGRFVDADRGYLVLAPHRFLATRDGGRTWSEER